MTKTTLEDVGLVNKNENMHWPGIEPGSVPWQGTILPLDHQCHTSSQVTVLNFTFQN